MDADLKRSREERRDSERSTCQDKDPGAGGGHDSLRQSKNTTMSAQVMLGMISVLWSPTDAFIAYD
jgi:hypothetical protein